MTYFTKKNHIFLSPFLNTYMTMVYQYHYKLSISLILPSLAQSSHTTDKNQDARRPGLERSLRYKMPHRSLIQSKFNPFIGYAIHHCFQLLNSISYSRFHAHPPASSLYPSWRVYPEGIASPLRQRDVGVTVSGYPYVHHT